MMMKSGIGNEREIDDGDDGMKEEAISTEEEW
jgi:hypothetical protein